jgi:uncharacterized protein
MLSEKEGGAMNACDRLPEEPWFGGGLRFKCTGCGKCCTGSSGSVSLSKTDLERLAAFFGQPVGAFARKHTRLAKGRRVLNSRPGSNDCVFLNNKNCDVYEARPTQCRTYPWWLTNLHDAEAWQEAAAFCEGINHPAAPIIPASEIVAQCRADIENDANLQVR